MRKRDARAAIPVLAPLTATAAGTLGSTPAHAATDAANTASSQVHAAQWFGRHGVLPQRTAAHATAQVVRPAIPSPSAGQLSCSNGPIESHPRIYLERSPTCGTAPAPGISSGR